MGKIFTTLFFIVLSITVLGQTVSFTYAAANGSTTLCSPAVINFTPVSTGNLIGYTWYFGNGQTSNSAIPSVTYTTGTYIVKLVAVFSNVALETTQTIVVNPGITANFTGNRSYICRLDTVGFNCITATPNATFLYDFADGSAPVSGNSSNVIHNFTAFGLYNTSVTVTNTFGCSFSDNFFVEVKPAPITSTVSPVNGCAPVNVSFAGTTVDVPPGSSVTNYAWSFGDGSAISNTASSGTTHPYTDSGIFLPTLTITTIEGCTNTFTYPSLSFGLAPAILYAYPIKTTYCASEIAEFVANSDFATSYKWEFGDGAIQFTGDTIISHKYNSLGIKTVRVTPINNECSGQPFTFTVNIIGVIASYNYANSCVAKNTFSFTNTSQGNQSFKEWIFGDGSPNVYTTNA
ncbi:MAG: PKD domain-containing protein, partial [Ferruginibacter sp.]|nr:PKD domain-containing protein [Ferruginibacter sp.]